MKNVLFKNQTSIDINKGKESKYGTFSDYAKMNPYYRIKDENGEYIKVYTIKGTKQYNPLYNAQLGVIDEDKYTLITNNFSIEWSINHDLRLRAQLGLQKKNSTSDNYLPADHTTFATATDSDSYFRKGKYTYGTGEDINIDANVTLSYSKIFHEKHQLYAGFDYSIAQKKNHFYTFIVEGFPDGKLISSVMLCSMRKMGYRKVRKNCLVGLVLPGMSTTFITIVISWIYLSVWMVHRCSGQK